MTIEFSCDGKTYHGVEGQNVAEVLKQNGIAVPTLCYSEGIEPCLGTCRVCMVDIDGRSQASCTQKLTKNMKIEVEREDLKEMRKAITELMFVEGNHYCPSCEKSGDCELQGLGYKMGITHSEFPYQFTHYQLDYTGEKLLLERNRCVHCKRCTDLYVDDHGHKVFSFEGKGAQTRVQMNHQLESSLSDHKRLEAMDLCPVGAIIYKGKGFDRPIGDRKYDQWGTNE